DGVRQRDRLPYDRAHGPGRGQTRPAGQAQYTGHQPSHGPHRGRAHGGDAHDLLLLHGRREVMKTISVVSPCYNEEANVEELYTPVRAVMAKLGKYRYEHIFIDNSSQDRTVEILKRMARQDSNVRVIVNARNFGQVRSPMHAVFQATGDAIIAMAADLQDPPE